jgi:hypothetical protein
VPGSCLWEPSQNEEFVIVIAILGHHLPCLLILYCYINVVLMTRRKFRTVIGGQKRSNLLTVATVSTATGNPSSTQDTPEEPAGPIVHKESSITKEKRIFITLSYILATYLICWVPFHIIFDLSFFKPELVSAKLYTFGFWLAYFNSTLNPIIYTYSNPEFRRAFKKVVTCK